MPMQYVCTIKKYHNCRVHDGGEEAGLKFFQSAYEALDFILKNCADTECGNLWTTGTGALFATIVYEISLHSVVSVSVDFGFFKISTIDNGSGKMLWSDMIDRLKCKKCEGSGHKKPEYVSVLDAVLPVRRCSECGEIYDQLSKHICAGVPVCSACEGTGWI